MTIKPIFNKICNIFIFSRMHQFLFSSYLIFNNSTTLTFLIVLEIYRNLLTWDYYAYFWMWFFESSIYLPWILTRMLLSWEYQQDHYLLLMFVENVYWLRHSMASEHPYVFLLCLPRMQFLTPFYPVLFLELLWWMRKLPWI